MSRDPAIEPSGDPLEDLLRNLNDAAEDLAGTVAACEAGENARRCPVEGSDPDGAFSVVVDEQGYVREVRPHADWRNRIDPAQIGSAVMAAVDAALRRQWEACREAVESADRSVDRTGPARDLDAPAIDLLSLQSELASVFDALDSMDLDSEPLGSSGVLADEDVANQEDSIGEQRVTVQLTSTGDIAGVKVNPRWAGSASRSGLAEQINEAFGDAYANVRPEVEGPAVQMSPELEAFIADPAAAVSAFLRAY